jgi:glycosyltransferase involved in cell wall biosynthesis
MFEVEVSLELVSGKTESDSKMLKGRDLLCFSHDWNSDPLSKTHLMRLLAKENRVLWVNSIGYRTPTASKKDFGRAWKKLKAAAVPVREAIPNLFVLNPLVIPAMGNTTVRRFNQRFLRWQVKRAMRKLNFKRTINWVFNPAASIIAGELGEEKLIYYCVDEYTAFSGVNTQTLIDMEQKLIRRADLVIVSAQKLLESKQSLHPHTYLVRHGVDFDHFQKVFDSETIIPESIANLPRPILGYFGLMTDDWVDLSLLKAVAERYSHGSLVLLGKSGMDLSELITLPNVHYLGRQPYGSLPGFCKGFDAALIPFPISEVTLNANPLKAREYLAAGLPVISTAIPEVEFLGECGIGHDLPEFLTRIEEALLSPGPNRERSEKMRSESWQARLEQICQLLDALPERKPA